MQIYGQIFDTDTHAPLAGASVTVLGKQIGDVANDNGSFYLNDPQVTDGDILSISFVGYTTQLVDVSELSHFNAQNQTPVIFLKPNISELQPVTVTAHKPGGSWLLLLAGAGALVYAANKKKRSSVVGEMNVQSAAGWVIIGGAVLLLPFALKLLKTGTDITTAAGLTDSDARVLEDNIYNSGSFPLFSNYYDKIVTNAPSSVLWETPDYSGLIDQLQSARGILFESTSDAIAVFSQLKSQFEVADFARQFLDQTGQDLFTYMRKEDTLFSQGFKSQTVATIIQMIQKLPVY